MLSTAIRAIPTRQQQWVDNTLASAPLNSKGRIPPEAKHAEAEGVIPLSAVKDIPAIERTARRLQEYPRGAHSPCSSDRTKRRGTARARRQVRGRVVLTVRSATRRLEMCRGAGIGRLSSLLGRLLRCLREATEGPLLEKAGAGLEAWPPLVQLFRASATSSCSRDRNDHPLLIHNYSSRSTHPPDDLPRSSVPGIIAWLRGCLCASEVAGFPAMRPIMSVRVDITNSVESSSRELRRMVALALMDC
jgi:hypothetical protein